MVCLALSRVLGQSLMISAKNADSLGNTGTILVTDDTINDLAVQIFASLLIFFFSRQIKNYEKRPQKICGKIC